MGGTQTSGVGLAVSALAVLIVGVVLAFGIGSQLGGGCANPAAGSIDSDKVPRQLVPIFVGAAQHYKLGSQGPAVLAALTKIESDFGRNQGPSSAGAIGWTQFMPATWAAYGIDANGDGKKDPHNAEDAIYSAANYLRASGAPGDWRKALFAYNHADWYVDKVLAQAEVYGAKRGTLIAGEDTAECEPGVAGSPEGARRINGGGGIVAIPGEPGERIDKRILADVLWLKQHYHLDVTDGYATSGHAADGEHPLGLGLDVVPGRGGSWDEIDQLARWAEPKQNQPRPPFRWVGYQGDANHGRGHHLHLSWQWGGRRGPPTSWVLVMDLNN